MPSDEKSPVKLSLPLDFQQEIFRSLRDEDQLLVLARGLGLLQIVTNLLHSYDAVGNNLIILIGAEDRENGWIGEALAEHAAISQAPLARGLSLVNTDAMSVATRQKMYAQGGIFSITSRILIVDFLVGLLDPSTVTGMVVLHAERVFATSLEAFILRIYRQKNKKGFLKAFSDSPEPFASGFSPLATMMRNLFLRKPTLYPRFHVTVAESLEGKRKAEVIELEVPMTDAMRAIQNAIMECVEANVSELKKLNSGIDMEEWNLDNALHRSFDVIVRRRLEPVWHRTSFKTRQIVRDLTLLRQILHALLVEDAVSFNRYLDTVLAASTPPPNSTRQNQSPWLFLDAAHTIFDTAKRRVYTGKLSPQDSDAPKPGQDSLHPVLEEQPKWAVLSEILAEIERDAHFNPPQSDDSNGTILIMCGEQSTCRLIREYLQSMYVRPDNAANEDDDDERGPSASFMMRRKLRNYLAWKRDFSLVSSSLFSENVKAINSGPESRSGHGGGRGKGPPNKRRRVRGAAASASGPSRNGMAHVAGDKEAHLASLLSDLAPTHAETEQKDEIGADPLEDMDEYFELFDPSQLVVVHPYDGDNDSHLLTELRPRYIMTYEPDAAFIRRVELYRSSHSARPVRVYFLYYAGSVEEQRYLSAVRREKDAFTKLIRERGSMAVTLDTAGNLPGAADPQDAFLRTVNTRIAGGGRLAATAQQPRVVVDVREFRSALPGLLHARGVQVVPCMLTVGDFVLAPGMCVERKSVRDLIASFANGRLFAQCEAMTPHYRYPMVLVEFDANRAFTLEPFADFGSKATGSAGGGEPGAIPQDLQSRIVLLNLAFPKVKMIWSSSPYQTAEIFEELKKSQDEPDPVAAVQVGLDPAAMVAPEDALAGAGAGGQVNQTAQDMLRAIPGVTEKAAERLSFEVGSLWELANMEEEEVGKIVGMEIARGIWRFFNRDVYQD